MDFITFILAVSTALTGFLVIRKLDTKNNSLEKINRWFQSKSREFDNLFEKRMNDFEDNSSALKVAITKAQVLSNNLEEDLFKLDDQLESYKDYEASVKHFQNQVDEVEYAYMTVLDKIDAIMKDKQIIENTYKRIDEVKKKMNEMEGNIENFQEDLMHSYDEKFAVFEDELYKRFDILAENLTKKDELYNQMVEGQKERLKETLDKFKLVIEEKESGFNEYLDELGEELESENVKRIKSFFESTKDELLGQYFEYTGELEERAKSIEGGYDKLETSREEMEKSIDHMKAGLQSRLDELTAHVRQKFEDDVVSAKKNILDSLDESINEIVGEKDGLFDKLDRKAEKLEGKISSIEEEKNNVLSGYKDRLAEAEDALGKIEELSAKLIQSSEQQFENAAGEIEGLKAEYIQRGREEMEDAVRAERAVLEDELNALKQHVELESANIREVVENTNVNVNDIIGNVEQKKTEFEDEMNDFNKTLLEKTEEHAMSLLEKLNSNYENVLDEIDEKLISRIEEAEESLKKLEEHSGGIETEYEKEALRVRERFNEFTAKMQAEADGKVENKIAMIDTQLKEVESFADNAAKLLDEKISAYDNAFNETKEQIEQRNKAAVDAYTAELDKIVDEYKNGKVRSLHDEIEKANSLIAKTQESSENVQQKVEESLNRVNERLNSGLEELMNANKLESAQSLDEMKEQLKNEAQSILAGLTNKEEDFKRLKSELIELDARAQSTRDDLNDTFVHAFESLKQRDEEQGAKSEERYKKISSKIDDLMKKKEEELEQFITGFKDTLDNITDATAGQMEEMVGRVNDFEEELGKENSEKLHEMAQRLNELKNKSENLLSEFENEKERVLSGMSGMYKEFETKLDKKAQDSEQRTKELHEEIESSREKLMSEVQNAVKTVEAKVNAVVDSYAERENELKRSAVKFEEEIRGKIGALAEEYEERYSEETSAKIEAFAQFAKNLQDNQKELRDQIVGLYEKQVADIKDNAESVRADLEKSYDFFTSGMKELEDSYKDEKGAFKKFIKEARSKAINEIKGVGSSLDAKMNMQIDKINSKMDKVFDDAREDVEEFKVLLGEKNADKLHDVNSAIQDAYEAISKLKEDVDSELNETGAKLRDYKAIVNKGIDESVRYGEKAAEERVRDLDSFIAAAKDNVDNEVESLTNEKLQIEDELRSMQNSVKNSKTELDRLKEDYMENIKDAAERLKDDIEYAKQKLEKKVERKDEELHSKIDSLEVELRSDIQSELKKAGDDIGSFKTDMLNNLREHIKKEEAKSEERLRSLDSTIENASSKAMDEVDGIRKQREDLERKAEELNEIFNSQTHDMEKFKNEYVHEVDEKVRSLESYVEEMQGSVYKNFKEKEEEMSERLSMLDKELKEVAKEAAREQEEQAERLSTTLKNIAQKVENKMSGEIADIKPKIEKTLSDVLNQRYDIKDGLKQSEEELEELRSKLKNAVHDLSKEARDDIDDKLAEIDRLMKNKEESLLDEFRQVMQTEYARAKEDINSDSEQNKKTFEMMIEQAQQNYHESVEGLSQDIEGLKDKLQQSASEGSAAIEEVFEMKGRLLEEISSDEERMAQLKERIDQAHEGIQPLVDGMKEEIGSEIETLNAKIDEASGRISEGEQEFSEKLNGALEDMRTKYEQRDNELQELIDDFQHKSNKDLNEYFSGLFTQAEELKLKNKEVIQGIEEQWQSMVQEKSAQYFELQQDYDELRKVLDNLSGSVKEELDSRIQNSEKEIESGLAEIEDKLFTKQQAFLDEFSSKLDGRVSSLLTETEEKIKTLRDRLSNEYELSFDKMNYEINDVKTLIQEFDKKIDEVRGHEDEIFTGRLEEIKESLHAQYEDVAAKIEEKSLQAFAGFDESIENLNRRLTDTYKEITDFKDVKSEELESEIYGLQTKFKNAESEINSVLNELEVLDQAADISDKIKQGIKEFNSIYRGINEKVQKLDESKEDFEAVKQMHSEIMDLNGKLDEQRGRIDEFEQRAGEFYESANDIEEKVMHAMKDRDSIPMLQKELKEISSTARMLEKNYEELSRKQNDVHNDVERAEEALGEYRRLETKIEQLQGSVDDIEYKRQVLNEQLMNMKSDTEFFQKNEEKIRRFMQNVDHIDELMKMTEGQKRDVTRMQGSYKDFQDYINRDIQKAQDIIEKLEELIKESEELEFENFSSSPAPSPLNKPARTGKAPQKQKGSQISNEDKNMVVSLYTQGWAMKDIVRNVNLSQEQIKQVIDNWKLNG